MTIQAQPVTEPGADPARFTLAECVARDATALLLHRGRAVGRIAGVSLVAHFPVEGVGWLVMTDCDCPFEEMLFLHLLDRNCRRLQTKSFGAPYCPGIVEDVMQTGPARFSFCFPGPYLRHDVYVRPERRGVLFWRTAWLHVSRVDLALS
jgi:hypothetical protein